MIVSGPEEFQSSSKKLPVERINDLLTKAFRFNQGQESSGNDKTNNNLVISVNDEGNVDVEVKNVTKFFNVSVLLLPHYFFSVNFLLSCLQMSLKVVTLDRCENVSVFVKDLLLVDQSNPSPDEKKETVPFEQVEKLKKQLDEALRVNTELEDELYRKFYNHICELQEKIEELQGENAEDFQAIHESPPQVLPSPSKASTGRGGKGARGRGRGRGAAGTRATSVTSTTPTKRGRDESTADSEHGRRKPSKMVLPDSSEEEESVGKGKRKGKAKKTIVDDDDDDTVDTDGTADTVEVSYDD